MSKTKSTCEECGGKLMLSIFRVEHSNPMPFHYRECRHDDIDRFFNTHTSIVINQYYKKVYLNIVLEDTKI